MMEIEERNLRLREEQTSPSHSPSPHGERPPPQLLLRRVGATGSGGGCRLLALRRLQLRYVRVWYLPRGSRPWPRGQGQQEGQGRSHGGSGPARQPTSKLGRWTPQQQQHGPRPAPRRRGTSRAETSESCRKGNGRKPERHTRRAKLFCDVFTVRTARLC